MPVVPGPGFTMVQAEFLFGALEALLNGPAQTRRTCEFRQARAGRRKHEVVGTLLGVAAVAADQNPALERAVDGPQRNARPVIQPNAFRSLAGSMRRPGAAARSSASSAGSVCSRPSPCAGV